MEVLSVKNLNFQYESDETFSLQNINIEVQRGEMVLFCGPCGCGKTTLFRLLKEELKPVGTCSGTIDNYYGNAFTGYLFQDPDSQIVCQTVEEELVFGAENLGMPPEEMARAVAEISAYLGIEDILHSKTTQLSGGQKQMVNLASILLMKPKLLLLDEPISQLDPVSTYEFIQLVRKLKDELDMTILIIEHNLEAFLKEADRVVYMEEGAVAYDGDADGFLNVLYGTNSSFRYSMPETVKVYVAQQSNRILQQNNYTSQQNSQILQQNNYPLTIKELLRSMEIANMKEFAQVKASAATINPNMAIRIKSGYFRYEKHAPDILKNLNLTLEAGRIYALIGGNGTGKSTLFSILSGYRKLYRGQCTISGRIGILPQNPVYAFFKDILEEDLQMVADSDRIQAILEEYEFCSGIRLLLHKNPLDLSGGQMQKAAIVKMLLNDAHILLMDEPVKAMDGHEKHLFGLLLQELKQAGKTILFISHDLEFVEANADEVMMLFDGQIIAKDTPQAMFRDNRFYTTVRGRIRGMIEDELRVNQ